jgi:hypothetical protein
VAVDLIFSDALNTSHPVNLVFGANSVPIVIPDAHISFSATAPAPTLTAHISAAQTIYVSSVIAVPTLTVSLKYDNAVFRGPSSHTKNDWQDGVKLDVRSKELTQDTLRLRTVVKDDCAEAISMFAGVALPMINGVSKKTGSSSVWQDGEKRILASSSSFSTMIRTRHDVSDNYSLGVSASLSNASGYQDRFRYPRPTLMSAWGESVKLHRDKGDIYSKAIAFPKSESSCWQDGRKPPSGTYTWTHPVTPPHVCYDIPSALSVPLVFKDAFVPSSDIIFYCAGSATTVPPAAQTVPIRRSYIVINSIHLKRVSDNIEIPDATISMSIDMDSWTWGFSATLPASAMSLVQPDGSGDPVLLEVSINGVPYRMVAESIKRDRVFGKSTITVTGRGQSANLSDPYSSVKSFTNSGAMTANQLMEEALKENGVSIGWAVDWRIDDWLVPAGVWTHRGTYMSAVTTIAASVGAFIQPDPVAHTLIVLPRSPVVPWDLATTTANIQLPSAPVIQESISWENRAEYDSVYVSGSATGGVLGKVVRTGSGGLSTAPMVTDILITHPVAARQRGIYELSKYGKATKYQLTLPILPETGIIMPGKIVRYTDDGNSNTGVVDSVRVNVTLPKASQTIDITTYG